MCYGCLHAQVTGEVQVTLEIQGSIKERKDSRGNIHASASTWSQDAKRRDLFAQDNADLTTIRVHAVFLLLLALYVSPSSA
jgi:hypothetical protein